MVNLSRRKIDERVLNKLFYILFHLLSKRTNKEDFMSVFVAFLSYSERIMMVKRIGVVYLLIKKIQKDRIQQVLSITRSTINKYELLMENDTNVQAFVKKVANKDNFSSVIDEIISFLYPPGTYGIDWKAAWERKKRIERRKAAGI